MSEEVKKIQMLMRVATRDIDGLKIEVVSDEITGPVESLMALKERLDDAIKLFDVNVEKNLDRAKGSNQ